MGEFSAKLREAVIDRADHRCEYCGLSQHGQEATFHIDHVVPRSAGGATHPDNLALACVSCSLRKWAKQTAVDPQSETEVLLFNPRSQRWSDHFRWNREQVVPLTAPGRATVNALELNRPLILSIRQEEMLRGRHPPE